MFQSAVMDSGEGLKLRECGHADSKGYLPRVRAIWLDIGHVFPSRSTKTQKRTRLVPSRLKQTSLVNKEFIMLLKQSLFLRDKAGTPERTR